MPEGRARSLGGRAQFSPSSTAASEGCSSSARSTSAMASAMAPRSMYARMRLWYRRDRASVGKADCAASIVSGVAAHRGLLMRSQMTDTTAGSAATASHSLYRSSRQRSKGAALAYATRHIRWRDGTAPAPAQGGAAGCTCSSSSAMSGGCVACRGRVGTCCSAGALCQPFMRALYLLNPTEHLHCVAHSPNSFLSTAMHAPSCSAGHQTRCKHTKNMH